MDRLTKSKIRKYLVLTLLGLILLISSAILSLPDQMLHIKFYDVGQGDAILVTTPSGKRILIDGGPGSKILEYLGKDLPFFDRKIDLVILTHPHEDHLSGLIEVVKRYQVGEIWMEKVVHGSDLYLDWLKVLKNRKVKVGTPNKGDILKINDGVQLNIVWPSEEEVGLIEDINDTSVVILVQFNSFDALLTGDAGEETQPYEFGQDLGKDDQLEALKVPHHGSKSGLREDFLKQLKPKVSVISVGTDNSFGHPSESILVNLRNVDSKVYRTDKNGTVEIVSGSQGWYTRTEK